MTGDPERAPLRVGFPQAYLHAGSEAAAGTMVALYHRQANGRGQFVDVSIQHSLVYTGCAGLIFLAWNSDLVAPGRNLPCSDGRWRYFTAPTLAV